MSPPAWLAMPAAVSPHSSIINCEPGCSRGGHSQSGCPDCCRHLLLTLPRTGHQLRWLWLPCRQLEVLRNSEDGSERGSLLWLLDHTLTAFGGRMLRSWVAHPLR